jgi:Uma2 family endonuclease
MGMPLTHRRFTVDEYHRMAEVGVFEEDDRVELLDGEIVEMTPLGSRHVACVVRLTDLLSRHAGEGPLVSVQNPLVLADRSEPQPDLVVLPSRTDLSGARPLGAADALLVIEVADTSVEHDRDVKIPLYARAGIPEVWLVNLPADRIEVYQDQAAGRYTTRRIVARGASLSPLHLPDVTLSAADILGPRAR